jgi:beta-N-acetylhexosaminidase
MNLMNQKTPFSAGHVVMVDIEGKTLDTATADFLRIHQIRGVCLFRKNLQDAKQLRRLTADLREAMGPLALIGIDQEGGSVARITFLPQAPSAMALGAIAEEKMAFEVGAAVSRGLRSMGINWNFAPVIDVNNNPANPVIAERSFGANPDHVARLAGAWMRGALHEGVACCVKHFPGHGDTHMDSHHALPTVHKTLEELESLELRPFRALAELAPAMMTAHIVYPQIDPEHPATLSSKVLDGILRQSIGYRGVVITDALMMKAVHDRYGHARSSVMALQAGADMVLAQGARHEQLAALTAITQAHQQGILLPARLEQACTRLETLARRFPAVTQDYSDLQRNEDEKLMRCAWAQALSTVGSAHAPHQDVPLRIVTQNTVISDGVSEAGLPSEEVQALFAGFSDVAFVALPDLTALTPNDLPRDGRFNVLVSNHRGRYGVQALKAQPHLHLVLWNPFQVMDIDAPSLITWGYAQGALSAVSEWLMGQVLANGRSPVPLAHQ